MTPESATCRGYRFPAEIINHAVWLYHVFSLILREVELILAERGTGVTHESVRRWCLKFGRGFADRLRRQRPKPGDTWHLDEVLMLSAKSRVAFPPLEVVMSLRPEPIGEIPAETARVARAAFPRGSVVTRLRDEFRALYRDEDFRQFYPSQGQPGLAPWRLALVTVFQFLENLSDRQAADAVRARIDWKYALGLELPDPGFHSSVMGRSSWGRSASTGCRMPRRPCSAAPRRYRSGSASSQWRPRWTCLPWPAELCISSTSR